MGNILRNAETNAPTLTVGSGDQSQTFYKYGEKVYAWEYDFILIKASRPIDDEEMLHLARLTGYAYSVMGSDGLEWPVRHSEDSFSVYADATKCRNRNFEDFHAPLNEIIANGSSIRKTNRSGAGTQGTRKHEPLPNVTVEIYLDEVFSFKR